jgi:hypothetical protein
MHKTHIEVANRKEGNLIRIALGDKTVRAFVLVMGNLIQLPTDRARGRVLRHVADYLEEKDELAKAVDAVDPVDGIVAS